MLIMDRFVTFKTLPQTKNGPNKKKTNQKASLSQVSLPLLNRRTQLASHNAPSKASNTENKRKSTHLHPSNSFSKRPPTFLVPRNNDAIDQHSKVIPTTATTTTTTTTTQSDLHHLDPATQQVAWDVDLQPCNAIELSSKFFAPDTNEKPAPQCKSWSSAAHNSCTSKDPFYIFSPHSSQESSEDMEIAWLNIKRMECSVPIQENTITNAQVASDFKTALCQTEKSKNHSQKSPEKLTSPPRHEFADRITKQISSKLDLQKRLAVVQDLCHHLQANHRKSIVVEKNVDCPANTNACTATNTNASTKIPAIIVKDNADAAYSSSSVPSRTAAGPSNAPSSSLPERAISLASAKATTTAFSIAIAPSSSIPMASTSSTPVKHSCIFPSSSLLNNRSKSQAHGLSSGENFMSYVDSLISSTPALPQPLQPAHHHDELPDSAFLQLAHQLDQSESTTRTSLLPQSNTSIGPSAASSSRLIVKQVRREHLRVTVYTVDPQRNADITIELHDEWTQSQVKTDDVVRVVLCDAAGKYVAWQESRDFVLVDANDNFFVIHPDTLISATVIANSFVCERKTVLDDMVRKHDVTPASVYGKISHELFQSALVQTAAGLVHNVQPLTKYLWSTARKLVADNTESLYTIDHSETEALQKLGNFIEDISVWLNQYVRAQGLVQGLGTDRTYAQVLRVFDVEESVHSPHFGIKGIIDATVQIKFNNGLQAKIPLELKTGKGSNNMYHRAQLVIYSLLLADMYDESVDQGLLLYFNLEFKGKYSTLLVQSYRNDLIGLVMARNRIALFSNLPENGSSQRLPPLLSKTFGACDRCFALDACIVQAKFDELDHELGTYGPSIDTFLAKSSHLNKGHADYYKNWISIIEREEKFIQLFRSEMWTHTASQREKLGNCLADLRVKSVVVSSDASEDSYHRRYLHCFEKQNYDLQRSNFNQGDYVIVSLQSDVYGARFKPSIRTGFVSEISETQIKMSLRSNLEDWASMNQIKFPIWRIDKEELLTTFQTVRQNLAMLFHPPSPGTPPRSNGTRLRQLLVDMKKPTFDYSRPEATKFHQTALDLNLNADQSMALKHVGAALDYVLILGMPGTGKTSTLASIILACSRMKKSVLLCSNTHSAVDNVLLRLKGSIDFIRLGNPSRVDHRIHPHIVHAGVHNCPDVPVYSKVEELKSKLEDALVVGTTCLGTRHPLFLKKKFDYVLIDEAGHAAEVVCLGPLNRFKSCFVLVGDHFQLSPLLRATANNTGNKPPSLFQRLVDAHPDGMISLSIQYRMSRHIMLLSNTLFYNNKLQCTSDAVSNSKISLDSVDENLPHWLRTALGTECVVALDTDSLPALETAIKGSYVGEHFIEKSQRSAAVNHHEVCLVSSIVERFLQYGLPADDILVLSPYRAQNSLLDKHFQSLQLDVPTKTIDQAQGQDKACVIISFVRSNSANQIGSLLRDWKRINVALTRAKMKLILIFSRSTFYGSSKTWTTLIDLLDQNHWIHQVTSEGWNLSSGLGFLSGVNSQDQRQSNERRVRTGRIPESQFSIIENGLQEVGG